MLKEKLRFATLIVCVFALSATGSAAACSIVQNVPQSKNEAETVAKVSGDGTKVVAVSIEYAVHDAAAKGNAPLALFVDVSGEENKGEWKKIGTVIPFGPEKTGEFRLTSVAVPVEMRAALDSKTSSFPVVLSYDVQGAPFENQEGLMLRSAVIVRD